jgi:hypothetical protein
MTDTNVCNDQDSFNEAVKIALENYEKEKKSNVSSQDIAVYVLYAIAMVVFLIWALYLVANEPKNEERVVHFLYAIILSPIYVLAHYINDIYD